MNLKRAMPLVVAVVLGLVAMLMARSVLKPSAPAKVSTGTTPLVVATRDVPLGKDLTLEDLAVAQVPSAVVPARSFTRPADLVGRAVTTPLVKGQGVLETLLAPEGSGTGITALVPNGMRAMTMNIDEVTGLAGMIQPGCRVDVTAIVPDARTGQQSARTVLQNIKILAVGRQLGAPPADGAPQAPSNNLTFLVTPEQARILQLAASTSRPWLDLRSGRDGKPLASDHTLVAELHGGGPEDLSGPATRPAAAPATVLASAEPTTRPAAPKPENFRVVQVIRGGVVSQVTLPIPATYGTGESSAGTEAGNETTAAAPVPEGDAPRADAPRPEKSARNDGDALRAAPEGLPAPKPAPAAVTGADPSDALKSDPFTGGPK